MQYNQLYEAEHVRKTLADVKSYKKREVKLCRTILKNYKFYSHTLLSGQLAEKQGAQTVSLLMRHPVYIYIYIYIYVYICKEENFGKSRNPPPPHALGLGGVPTVDI